MVDKKNNKKENKKNNKNPYRRIFFTGANVLSVLLLFFGFFGSLMVMATPTGNPFQAIAVFISIIWCVIFIQYFVWAIYYYNINYGLTDRDWDRKFKARENKANELPVIDADLKVPTKNPYQDETFGLPGGTVRGMIAFTLLFGAVALMLVSIGMDGNVDQNSFFRDHFEFFKTAFLMMIAFYFGNSALKILSKKDQQGSGRENDDDVDEEEDDDEGEEEILPKSLKRTLQDSAE